MKTQKILTIVNVALIISVLSILRIIIGYINNPPGFTYLAVGHYYLDYFEYLQQTAQGMMGHWTVLNQFATDDPTQTILGWGQYLIIGKIAKFLHLSVVSGYWLAVFFLVFFCCLSIYFIIKRLLPNLSFFYQLTAWFFCLFAAPFINNKLVPFDFWYAPMSFFHRFGGVPHHLLTSILTVGILILSTDIFFQLNKLAFLKLAKKIIIVTVLLLLLLTFAPLQVINLISAIFLLGLIFLIKNKLSKNLICFLLIIFFAVLPAAILIKISHDGSGLFQRAIAWESAQQNYPPLTLILLTIGPILFFAVFGLRKYFKEISNIRWLLLFYVFFSYLYFFSPLAGYFGTFNGRFLSPSVYILFGSLSILGIIEVGSWFGKAKKILALLLIAVLSGYFIWLTTAIFLSFGPVDQTSYLPNQIFNGIKFLGKQSGTKGVLTSPDKYFGLIVPVFADKNVYTGRMIFTGDLENKLALADRFYQGNMSPDEAKTFTEVSKIEYIFLTYAEKYPPKNLSKYQFLKLIYDKEGVKIYKVL